MAKMTFTERFDYRPTRSTWITYQPGTYDNVTRKAANAAMADGKAYEHQETRTRPATSGRIGRTGRKAASA